MLEFFKFACSGIWVFLGIIAIMTILVSVILEMWSRFFRYLMVSKHGWPPGHLNADGDWKEDKK